MQECAQDVRWDDASCASPTFTREMDKTFTRTRTVVPARYKMYCHVRQPVVRESITVLERNG